MTVSGTSDASPQPVARVGDHVRAWRTRRKWSQLRVAVECDVSTRHLSYVETGRARPSRELIVHLARHLGATNRELNVALVTGGLAPLHVVELEPGPLEEEATLAELIDHHEPRPAFVFDADWVIKRLNLGGQWLCSVLMPQLWCDVRQRQGGVDMIAALIHPGGLLSQMRHGALMGWAVLRQLRLEQLTNPRLRARADELERALRVRHPEVSSDEAAERSGPSFHLDFDTVHGPMSFFTLQSLVGIPQQITVATPRVELWFPADLATQHVIERSFRAGSGEVTTDHDRHAHASPRLEHPARPRHHRVLPAAPALAGDRDRETGRPCGVNHLTATLGSLDRTGRGRRSR